MGEREKGSRRKTEKRRRRGAAGVALLAAARAHQPRKEQWAATVEESRWRTACGIEHWTAPRRSSG